MRVRVRDYVLVYIRLLCFTQILVNTAAAYTQAVRAIRKGRRVWLYRAFIKAHRVSIRCK